MHKQQIIINLLGEPISTGSIYRSVCRGKFATVYMSKAGKDLKESYQWQIKSQYKGKPLDKPLSIALKLHFGTRRRCDWDNFHKLSMDACNGILWADDSQIQTSLVSKHYDKENPRIELEVTEL